MSKARILIVEDEAIVAEDLAGKLRRLGYEVAGIASGGQQAVALACRLHPALLLMDISLDGPMDGIEAADAIRRQHDVPVIYLTAHSDPATLARAKITDPFGYILKPFDEQDLATQMELALYKHQADRQLRQQREWLRVTLASIGDAVIATDADGRITFVNPVAEALTGWRVEEAVGQPVQCVFRVVNEQTGQPLEEPVARVLREGRAVELANHAALLTRDGRPVPIEDSAAPILDAAGQVIGVVLVFHDVTEKRRAEEALRRSSQFPKENPNPVLRVSGDGALLYANAPARGWLETLGWQAAGTLPAALLAIVVDARAQHHSIESEISSPTGNMFWVSAIQPPGEDYVNLYGRDVTERKRAEEALRESVQRYELVLTGSGGGIWDWDVPRRKVVFSPRWKAMRGFAEDEISDSEEEWSRGIHPEDAPRVMAAVQAHFEGETPVFAEEYRVRRKDDSWIWIADRGLAVRDADGRVVRMAGSEIDITDRKAAEEAIRQSEARFRALAEALPQIVWTADAAGTVEWFNRRWYEYTGETEGVGEGWSWEKVTHPDDMPHTLTKWQQAREQGTLFENEIRVRRHDGHFCWFLVRAWPLRDAHGRVVRWFGANTDIEEMKRAEAALRQSREDLDRAQKVGQIGSWRLDTRKNVLTWSDENYRIFGVPQGTPLTYETFLAIVHPDDRHYVDSQWNAGLRGEPYDIEHRIVAGGQVKWVREKAYLEFDDAARLLGGFGITQDITSRKRAEERAALLVDVTAQLLASAHPQQIVETLCRRVMDHLGCHVFFNYLLDDRSGRLRLNACGGISDEAAREIEWLDYGVAVCGCVARDGCRIVAEHIQTTPDPRTELVRGFGVQAYACHPLVNQNQTIGTLSFGSRTRPTFAEDELELMRAVADHVAIAMQRVRLLESLERHARAAEAANEAKGQFLANMSHELRTPMNAILGMIDVAIPKAADPTVLDCLQTAKGSADLLLTLLDDLLDSAKIESGKLDLESAPFSLRRMLDQLTRVLAVRASEKGLSFRCRMPDQTPDAVVGDRMRLQQVLLNLAGNAIKFTERGDVEIVVKALEIGDWGLEADNQPATSDPQRIPNPQSSIPSACLEFTVRDTGIGIPPSGLERLFQPFAQADVSMARRFGGTGLGLSISKSLVEMMGGTISVESELGRGSTFSFAVRLPLASEVPPDFPAPAALPSPACGQLRVLLVEDNPANQKLVTYILQDRGHSVEVAGDGLEALCLTERNRYDLILMDVQMPGMSGLEVTESIRKREGEKGSEIRDRGLEEDKQQRTADSASPIPNPQSQIPSLHVPIIAMTAHAMRGDRERCLAAGMDGYLSKPVNVQEMIGLVENLGGKGFGIGDWGFEQTPQSPVSASPISDSQRPIPVFDPDEAITRCFNSAKMLREMIQGFYDEVDKLFPQMRAALKKGDLVEVGRLGHRMKGTVVYLGAHPAKEAALRVERFCKCPSGTPSEAEEAINALEHECITLKDALVRHPLAAEPPNEG